MRNHQTADILLTFAEEQFDGFLQHYAAEYAKANVVYKSRNLLWRAARVDLQKLKAEVLGQQALEAKQSAATRAGLPLGAGMAAQPKELLAEYVGRNIGDFTKFLAKELGSDEKAAELADEIINELCEG